MIELTTASDSTLDYQTKLNFVEIAFARTRREAIELRDALRSKSIVSDIENVGSLRRGVAVLVESCELVRASELLATMAQDAAISTKSAYDDDDDMDDDFADDDDDDFSDDDDDDDFFDDDDDESDDDDDYEDDDDE